VDEHWDSYPAGEGAEELFKRTVLKDKYKELGIDSRGKHPIVLLHEIFERTVEHHLVQPTFVYDWPARLCPLTKRKADDESIAERFEPMVAGMEIGNAYTELNDPDVQDATGRPGRDDGCHGY